MGWRSSAGRAGPTIVLSTIDISTCLKDVSCPFHKPRTKTLEDKRFSFSHMSAASLPRFSCRSVLEGFCCPSPGLPCPTDCVRQGAALEARAQTTA